MSTPEEQSNLSSNAPDVPVEDALETHGPDDVAPDNDEPGDEEDEATRDLPSDDYSQVQDDNDDKQYTEAGG